MLAEDEQTDEAIAIAVKVSRRTLTNWKQHPDFEAKRIQHVEEMAARRRSRGLGRLDKRMDAYEDHRKRLMRIVYERAEDMADIPGGASGLLVRQYKSIGTGPNARQVEEYLFDQALSRELRELPKQAAQDTGQWSERHEVSGDLTAVVIREIRVPAADSVEGDA